MLDILGIALSSPSIEKKACRFVSYVRNLSSDVVLLKRLRPVYPQSDEFYAHFVTGTGEAEMKLTLLFGLSWFCNEFSVSFTVITSTYR